MKWLLLSVVLVACEPSKQIGENDPDASMQGDGSSDGATDDAMLTCACDASSCGARICGRSDCGYPCGECEPGEYCFVGNTCSAGVTLAAVSLPGMHKVDTAPAQALETVIGIGLVSCRRYAPQLSSSS